MLALLGRILDALAEALAVTLGLRHEPDVVRVRHDDIP